jgi:hypothetical protein
MYFLHYPGLLFMVPIPAQHAHLAAKEELPIEFPDGTTPVASRLVISAMTCGTLPFCKIWLRSGLCMVDAFPFLLHVMKFWQARGCHSPSTSIHCGLEGPMGVLHLTHCLRCSDSMGDPRSRAPTPVRRRHVLRAGGGSVRGRPTLLWWGPKDLFRGHSRGVPFPLPHGAAVT